MSIYSSVSSQYLWTNALLLGHRATVNLTNLNAPVTTTRIIFYALTPEKISIFEVAV